MNLIRPSTSTYDVLWCPWNQKTQRILDSNSKKDQKDRWQSCLDTKEPIHYVTYGSGMQTWDSCLQLACLQSLKL